MSTAFDPLDPAFRADPYPVYHRLRAEEPVYDVGFGDFFLLTRYADVHAALGDPRLGAFAFDSMRIFAEPAQAGGDPGPLGRTLRHWMVVMDPPVHTRLRALVSKAFGPRAVDACRPRIDALVAERLAAVAAGGRMDVMHDLARVLPVIVIAELLGIPAEDHAQFRRWSDEIAKALDPMHVWGSRTAGDRAVEEMQPYLAEAVAARRRRPGPDLMSALIAAEEAGDRLSGEELLGTVSMLLFAGNETTTNLIGNGMLALLQHPAELARLVRDPTLLRSAVDELLRYDTPVQSVVRVAFEDVAYGGKTIRRGQRLILNLGAANRDPAQFADPDRLDIGRQDNHHLAFGAGFHFCVGAQLARAEAAAAVGQMVRRLRRLRLGEPGPERRPTLLLRGLERLPVEFEPAHG